MRALLAAALLAAATPALADETTGVILAYDRADNVIVLTDRTVWELGAKTLVPADLKAGDTIRIDFEAAGENGIARIDSLEKL